ncbi:MAG: hypothetical protein GY816_00610 [Cytophagales bacterium]|nr:hypothetical protein [Cytophagales bacterium]
MFKKLLIPVYCLVLVFSGCKSKPDPWKEARKTYKHLDAGETYQKIIELLKEDKRVDARLLYTNAAFRIREMKWASDPITTEITLTVNPFNKKTRYKTRLKDLEIIKVDKKYFDHPSLKEKVYILYYKATYEDGMVKETHTIMTNINGFWQRTLSPEAKFNELYPYGYLADQEREDEEIVWYWSNL